MFDVILFSFSFFFINQQILLFLFFLFLFFFFFLCVIGVPISDMLYKDRHGHNSKDGKADVNPSTFLKFLANAGCLGEIALGREFFFIFLLLFSSNVFTRLHSVCTLNSVCTRVHPLDSC